MRNYQLTGLFFAFFLLTGFVKYDVPAICLDTTHKNLLDDNREALGIPESILETGTAKDITTYLVGRSAVTFGPWILQDVSRPNIAQAAYMIQGYLAQSLVDRLIPGGNIKEVLQKAAAQPAHYSPEALEHARQMMNYLSSDPISPELLEIKDKALLICTPYLDPGCPSALRDTVDLMSSRPSRIGAYISMLPVVQRILADDGLTQGSAHFALKVLGRIQRGRQAFINPPHLLQDLADSFLATGSSPEQAVDRAWTLVGMYGTRGASMSLLQGLSNKENLPVFLNLYLFSSALALFDSATLQSGTPYSYPEAILSRCAYHGPYHFWLSAYLSRAMRAKGHSQRSSVLAAHILSKLYEFGSQTFTRHPERPYRDKFFNPYNVMLQMNMAFNDGGALFGAGSDKKGQVALDLGLLKIFETAKPMPELTPEELERGIKDQMTRYSWFNRVIAPDAWINHLFNINGH